MASYQVKWKRSALKELKSLDQIMIKRILAAVQSLCNNPFPSGMRKLVGAEHTYRIRVGDYRVVYSVVKNELTLEVLRVGHRREGYR